MTSDVNSESFKAFKDSFAYGSRTDLNFKFLKALSAPEAAGFFQGLLWKLGDTFDDGQFERIIELTPHLMGRPVGAPNDRGGQLQTIREALKLLETARQGGTIVELPGNYLPVGLED